MTNDCNGCLRPLDGPPRNADCPRVDEHAAVCAWDGGTDDVREHGGELLCSGCRAEVARLHIVNAVGE